MAKICDHTSVGMFIWRNDRLLMIVRARPPYGVSIPAGHVDGDATFEIAAARELAEEVGLTSTDLKLLLEGRRDNVCRRTDGTWHYWKLYNAVAEGEPLASPDESRGLKWVSRQEIKQLAERAELYRAGKITDEDWFANPGLEPVMLDWFRELKII